MQLDTKRINSRLFKTEKLERCNLNQCQAACCFDGVWVDEITAENILNNSGIISPHLDPQNHDSKFWFDDRKSKDPYSLSSELRHTTVIPNEKHYQNTSCIFLREDKKCGLQTASEELGYHPWHFKPFYCILHPLDLDNNGKITLDETSALINEPASCLSLSKTDNKIIEVFSEELSYLIGKEK